MSDYSNSEIPNGLYYADVAVLAKIFAKRYGTSVNAAYEWLTKDAKVPSVDVRSGVRCENCKHCETTDNYIYCHEWRRETSIDGYCYKGDVDD